MKIAIIGGRLQGTESAYLARKAGIKTVLIDKQEHTPASGLADECVFFDVTKKEPELIEILKAVDFILPALENDGVHQALVEIAKEHGLKLAFDKAAYAITESKLKSDALIKNSGLPCPGYYPDCLGPYIIKPSEESGSVGVTKADTAEEVEEILKNKPDRKNWIVQEYLEGPSYSIEVVGVPGNYRAYKITKIHMDEVYDCKRVTSPCPVTLKQTNEFEAMGIKLAELVSLHGIMDVEVIEHEGVFKILEIDARIPSQTPTAVYHASGVNLLSELADVVTAGKFSGAQIDAGKYCSYEHFIVSRQGAQARGEHIMSNAGPLKLREKFCGADEVISDYVPEKDGWNGTFINWADSLDELEKKRENMLRVISCADLRQE